MNSWLSLAPLCTLRAKHRVKEIEKIKKGITKEDIPIQKEPT